MKTLEELAENWVDDNFGEIFVGYIETDLGTVIFCKNDMVKAVLSFHKHALEEKIKELNEVLTGKQIKEEVATGIELAIEILSNH
jgi:hypothetical protein